MTDNLIGNQAGNIASGLKEGIEGAMETVSDLAGRVQNTSAATLNTLQGTAKEAGTRVSDLAAETCKQGAAAGEYLSRTTAEQPLLALLLAATVGYAIAYLVHRR
jgi:hypothetical protein